MACVENGNLAVEPQNRAVHVRLAQQHAGIVHEVASGKVIGAVNDDVVITQNLQRIRTGQLHFVSDDVDFRIQVLQTPRGHGHLRLPDIRRRIHHLALQVGDIDAIEIDDADASDTGRGQIKRDG